MSWEIAVLILVAAIAVTIVAGLWTAFALGASGMLVLYLGGGRQSLESLGSIAWNNTSDFVLTAVPLFLLMGQFILHGGISEGFFKGVDFWSRWARGGLMPGSILSCGIFSATTGSSVTTAAAVGTVALPEMRRRGYSPGFAAGAIAGGGTLGILIPPSIPLIIYGAVAGQSVTELFAGALLPGVILMLAFTTYVMVRAKLNPSLVGGLSPSVGLRERLRALPAMTPVILLVGTVIGTIYAGVATPTEAAALGALGAFVISLRRMTLARFVDAVRGSLVTTVMIFAIILGAQLISFALVDSGASREISTRVVELGLGKITLLLVITVVFIILGDFIDGVSMMLLTLPVLYPIVVAVGFDPLVFGVMMVLFIELGQITPPVGLNLFVIHGIDRSIPHGAIIKAALPYGAIMVGLVFVVAALPQLVLWLAEGAGG